MMVHVPFKSSPIPLPPEQSPWRSTPTAHGSKQPPWRSSRFGETHRRANDWRPRQPNNRLELLHLLGGALSGEGGIRTPGAARAHTISSRAVSTGLTHLSVRACPTTHGRCEPASIDAVV